MKDDRALGNYLQQSVTPTYYTMAKRTVKFGIQKVKGLYYPRIIGANGKLMLNEGVANRGDLEEAFEGLFCAIVDQWCGRNAYPDLINIPASKKWPRNAGPKAKKKK